MKIRIGFGRNLPLAAAITAVYNELNLFTQHYCLNSMWLCHVIALYPASQEQNSITLHKEATFHRILAYSQTGVLINHDFHVNRSLFHMSAMTLTTWGSEVTVCRLLRVFSPWEFIQTSHSPFRAKNLSERDSFMNSWMLLHSWECLWFLACERQYVMYYLMVNLTV